LWIGCLLQTTEYLLTNRRNTRKPATPTPSSPKEAGSGIAAEKLPEMFEVKLFNVSLVVSIEADGVTFVKASDPFGIPTFTSDVIKELLDPRGMSLAEKVRLFPAPKTVAPVEPTFPTNIPDR
jgi:hypothetical protein